MKKRLTLLLILLLALPLIGMAAAADGKVITVSLPENPSTGYQWRAAEDPENIFKIAGDSYLANPAAIGTPGAGGLRSFTFEAVKQGEATLSFVLAKAWDGSEKPVQIKSFTYRVGQTSIAQMVAVDITQGQVRLSLDANQTTGYEWRYTLSQNAVLTQMQNQYVSDDNPEQLAGIGGMQLVGFSANAPGEVVANFTYSRSWETDPPLENMFFTFLVDQDGYITLQNLVLPPYDKAAAVPQPTSNVPPKRLALSAEQTQLVVGESLPLTVVPTPADAALAALTFKSSNAKIASVDEKGVVTAHQKGKVTLTVTMAGSKLKGTMKLSVNQPAQGIHFTYPDVRVGAGVVVYINAVLDPKGAESAEVVWESADSEIATVSGDTTKARLNGHKWGRTTVTATLKSTGQTAVKNVNVGSLLKAIKVESVKIKDGKPSLVFKNISNMNLTQIRYEIIATDAAGNPIPVSTDEDVLVMKGTYDRNLAPGKKTEHGKFTFKNPTDFAGLAKYSIVITGFKTDTGYYATGGYLLYDCTIDEKNLVYVQSTSD